MPGEIDHEPGLLPGSAKTSTRPPPQYFQALVKGVTRKGLPAPVVTDVALPAQARKQGCEAGVVPCLHPA